ncbi:lipopolysaccharide biosynthesis protein [Butyrivibrio sp. XPD2006]|uniref:lipopolysaccharide biosynthesis protein n=1 Tax=Butyrivibrio sp. XPD2006 TaxID=1280668 RepID=UPI0003B6C441|nr:oligosaccharide flippase family protein [Butyrivibrio sp. XPD2006]
MSREKEFAKNTFILALGQFLPNLFSILYIPLITGHFSTSEYGEYDYLLTIISLLLPIATLQIHSSAFRFLIEARENKEKSKSIISSIFFFTLIVSLITVLIFACIYTNATFERIIIGMYIISDAFFTLLSYIARGLADNVGYSIASFILSGLKTMFVFICLVFLKSGLWGVLTGICLSYILAMLFIFIKEDLLSYISVKSVSLLVIKECIAYSWPMVPNNLSNWVLKVSDRIVITFFLGVEANAIYAAANNIPNILNMAKSVVVMAWQENASIALNDKDAAEYYSKVFKDMLSLIAGITALIIVSSPLLFILLIRGSYEDAYYQMPILFLGVFFGCMSSFQGGIYIAHKRTVNVGVTTIIAAVINLLLDLLLVNSIGISAGSVSTLVSYLFLFVFRLFDIKRFQEINYSYIQIIAYSVFLGAICIFSLFRTPFIYVLNALLGFIFAININRAFLLNISKKLLRKSSM